MNNDHSTFQVPGRWLSADVLDAFRSTLFATADSCCKSTLAVGMLDDRGSPGTRPAFAGLADRLGVPAGVFLAEGGPELSDKSLGDSTTPCCPV